MKMSLLIRTDVTAVKLYEDFIIAGIGSSLQIYEKNTGKSFEIHNHVLEGQKIYGIVPTKDKSKILIFGGKQFKVIHRSNLELRLFDFSPGSILCDDWLHSGGWTSDNKIALLTAHNVIQVWHVSNNFIISYIINKDNSILYSGLITPLIDDILVFSGTVFSEVIISRCEREEPLHRLKGHKGVIFSISCSIERGIIVTTSDDRSVRIWGLNGPAIDRDTKAYWDSVTISCIHELYGHLARVMRSCITNRYVISVGEDSGICFWDSDGTLLKKIGAHQNAPIWSVDVDEHNLVTGGADCGVTTHPLTVANDYSDSEILRIGEGTPKKLVFTARRNLAVLNDTGHLIYYVIADKTEYVHKIKHDSTYVMLSISPCKQIIAVADMNGSLEVFVENCKGPASVQNVISTKLPINKILSMHWVKNRHLVLCSESGDVSVIASKGSEVEIISKFLLPHCKERWLTSAAMNLDNNLLVVGDRCGNIHCFIKEDKNPIKTFAKVHGRYGPTSIRIKNNEIISTGRDGTIKYFSVNYDNGVYRIRHVSSKDLGFQWVEKCIDSQNNLICGFQERVFVIIDLRNNSKLLEVPCGGGHRSWDVVRYIENINNDYEQIIKLVYLKNSDINIETFFISKITSKYIIKGTHSKEINCLKSHHPQLEESVTFFISGGEDTTLRVSSAKERKHFQDEVILKHLSSIRTLKVFLLESNKLLVVSGGGRAQICINIIHFVKDCDDVKVVVEDVVDFLVKGTDKERKGDKTWRNCSVDFDPETRIMDLEIVKNEDNCFRIYAGCSDAYLRIFQFKYNEDKVTFKPLGQLKYHKTCILKTHCVKFLDKIILMTCTTRGEVCFWDVTEPTSITDNDATVFSEPFLSTTTNKSGINCIASKIISDSETLFATGGDDSAIHVKLVHIPNEDFKSAKIVHNWTSDKFHSSQITGVLIIDNILVTASIDQRVTVFKISKNGRDVEFLCQAISDVADIQGIDLVKKSRGIITVCVFGKGLEVLALSVEEASLTSAI